MGRESDDTITSGIEKWIGANEKCVSLRLNNGFESQFQFAVVACKRNVDALINFIGRLPQFSRLGFSLLIVRIYEYADNLGVWHQFVKQSEPLRFWSGREQGNAGDVSPPAD